MEPIYKGSGRVKGIEVLYFADAELQKIKGTCASFASTGPLSVVYIKDYDRFFLHLNDWSYPLMRRLPVSGLGKDEMHSRSYSFPAPNGFQYRLRINLSGSDQALENFEGILQESSRFSWMGEQCHGKLSSSPDDKLCRKVQKESSFKNVISETIKHGVQSIKNKVQTMKSGTKNITSRKKMTDLKSIKTKNFKKTAQSKLKKDFFESGEKQSQCFLKLRQENLNLILTKSYEELKKTSDSQAPSLYLSQDEIENSILNLRDVASQGNFNLEFKSVEKPTVKETIREGVRDIKEGLTGERRRDDLLGRDRNVNPNPTIGQPNIDKVPGYEGMTHYEG